MATTPPTPTLPPCARGLSADDLSAYRDGVISGGEGALDAHIAGCPACRTRLERLEQLAEALRAEQAPGPDERLWQALRRAAEGESQRRPGRRLRLLSGWRGSAFTGQRPLWSGLGALAAVLLLVLGFAQLFALHGASTRVTHVPTATPSPMLTPQPTPTLTPTPMPMPTSTLLPPHPLAWQAENPPYPTVFDTGAIVPAADGQTAYACAVSTAPQLLTWTTHDGARSWTPAQIIPPAPNVNGCELVVDTSDPSVAALCWSARGGGAGDSCTNWMTTVDGGASWQALPYQPFVAYDQLDSRAGTIYAVRETVDSSNAVQYHLAVSRDRLRTWTNIGSALSGLVAGFWLQPSGRAILAVTTAASDQGSQLSSRLWLSPDGGSTWQLLNPPVSVPVSYPRQPAGPQGNGVVAASGSNGAFTICLAASSQATSGSSNTLTCSFDSGASWTPRSALNLEVAPGTLEPTAVVGITSDGAVLAEAPDAQVTTSAPPPGYTLYRLTLGVSNWQSLGPLPQAAVTYCPTPGAGMLWAVPAFAANLDPQHRVFTAAYTP